MILQVISHPAKSAEFISEFFTMEKYTCFSASVKRNVIEMVFNSLFLEFCFPTLKEGGTEKVDLQMKNMIYYLSFMFST